MVLSMTGFVSKAFTLKHKGEEIPINIEIKSLNSRFFECNCRLLGGLDFLEIPIINLLKYKLRRGKVFVFMKSPGRENFLGVVVPDIPVVEGYLDSAKKIKNKFKIDGELKINDVVRFPNVLSFEQKKIGQDFIDAVLNSVEKASVDLVKVRKSEGGRIEKDLIKIFKSCENHIAKIRKLFDAFMKKQKEEAKKLLSSSQKGSQEAEKKLSEHYEMINKIDVHEEIVRFESHLKESSNLLKNKSIEKGRRFDFIIQELGREINTIAAKCSCYDISSVAVDVKVDLEKIREQVQNIV